MARAVEILRYLAFRRGAILRLGRYAQIIIVVKMLAHSVKSNAFFLRLAKHIRRRISPVVRVGTMVVYINQKLFHALIIAQPPPFFKRFVCFFLVYHFSTIDEKRTVVYNVFGYFLAENYNEVNNMKKIKSATALVLAVCFLSPTLLFACKDTNNGGSVNDSYERVESEENLPPSSSILPDEEISPPPETPSAPTTPEAPTLPEGRQFHIHLR